MASTGESSSNVAAPPPSTPVRQRSRTNYFTTAPPPLQYKMKTTLVDETKDRYVGPVAPKQFLDDYLPCPDLEPAPPLEEGERSKLEEVTKAASEKAMYLPFKDALQRFVTGMKFADTSKDPAEDGILPGTKPDFCLYLDAENPGSHEGTNFSAAELCIELKPTVSYDPFQDLDLKANKGGSSASFEKDTVQANETRGQITSYAVRQFGSQYRFFAFSVVVFGNRARLIRWDRSGAVVSASFDYCKESAILVDFLWRFAHMSPQERGHDPTVSPNTNLSEETEQKIREKLGLNAEDPLRVYHVPDEDGSRPFYGRHFPRPNSSLIGRSTRTVPVCYLVGGEIRLAFLKEYWGLVGVRGEVDVYKHLEKFDIPHIVPLVCGGEVRDGETRTHERVNNKDSSPVMHLCLHRLVLAFVGRQLTEFKCTKELAQAVLHAMEAHWQAYEKAGVLHRDISVNNILIDENGNGVLIDWELALFLNDPIHTTVAKRHDRTGTWQFISAALLTREGHSHELADDIESFVHVLGWTVLSYLPSPMDIIKRTAMVSLLYDHSFKVTTGQEEGGLAKEEMLRSGNYPPERFTLTEPSPILELIRELASPFQARYGKAPTEADLEAFKLINTVVANGQLPKEVLYNQRAHQYELRMSRLSSSKWFLGTIQDALQRPDWPAKDGAGRRLTISAEGTARQKQLAEQRVQAEAILVSASSGPLKRPDVASPPRAQQHKRSRVDDEPERRIA
ncbi:hypothetical protein EDD15DRAFT_2374764 [Pisolithus albus]|nr:hypothetical protein EDD15DRAFT_2374764 [Pisolithus albus]